MDSLALALATWFGCGRSPVAPGTVGSLGALLVAWPLVSWLRFQPWHFLLLAVVLTPLGIWSSSRVAAFLNREDPQCIVIDEVLGQWIALAGAPLLDWRYALAAFVLFRLFDITKPWPVRRLESLPSGAGIVADDLGAGVYAAAILWLSRFVVQF